jgi:hypothetical protein
MPWLGLATQDDIKSIWEYLTLLSNATTAQEKAQMSGITDLVEQLKVLKSEVERLAAINTADEQAVAEVHKLVDETTKIAKQAADDDASKGGSTGTGSGA